MCFNQAFALAEALAATKTTMVVDMGATKAWV
jgi:hypothetical protein